MLSTTCHEEYVGLYVYHQIWKTNVLQRFIVIRPCGTDGRTDRRTDGVQCVMQPASSCVTSQTLQSVWRDWRLRACSRHVSGLTTNTARMTGWLMGSRHYDPLCRSRSCRSTGQSRDTLVPQSDVRVTTTGYFVSRAGAICHGTSVVRGTSVLDEKACSYSYKTWQYAPSIYNNQLLFMSPLRRHIFVCFLAKWGFFGPSSIRRGRTHIVLG